MYTNFTTRIINSMGALQMEAEASISSTEPGDFGSTIGCGPSEPESSQDLLQKCWPNKSKPDSASKMGASRATKVPEMSSVLGRVGNVGLEKAVEVLDILGSSMTNLNLSGGFITKGNKISILAFEVANTIAMGVNLMQSLSKDNVKHLKEVVLPSKGVQLLVSTDMDELLRIAAADMRDELKAFSKEVARFGNLCIHPQWRNLGYHFEGRWPELPPQRQFMENKDKLMQQLMTLVQYTRELYHELHALDRIEQDYRCELEKAMNSNVVQIRDKLAIIRVTRKHVRSLKKKSLWFKNLEEVIEKLVVIVHFLLLSFNDAFGNADNGDKEVKRDQQRLGSADLALHYAKSIIQLDTLASKSSSVPPNIRDTLYEGLPLAIKSALRKSHIFQIGEELTVPQIKAEIEKTLQWLVPIAANTIREIFPPCARRQEHNRLELRVFRSEVKQKEYDLMKLQTLHHADKEKTEAYMLEVLVLLHHLVSRSRYETYGIRSPIKYPTPPPSKKKSTLSLDADKSAATSAESGRKFTQGRTKRQEADSGKSHLSNRAGLSRSSRLVPSSGIKEELSGTRNSSSFIGFDMDRIKAMDIIDGIEHSTEACETTGG